MDYTDDEVDRILSQRHADVLGDREIMVRYPDKAPSKAPGAGEARTGEAGAGEAGAGAAGTEKSSTGKSSTGETGIAETGIAEKGITEKGITEKGFTEKGFGKTGSEKATATNGAVMTHKTGVTDGIGVTDGADKVTNAAKPETGETGTRKSALENAAEDQALRISLEDALEIAFQTNRRYLSERESLYISVLSLINARHTFSPQLSAVLSYLYSDGTGVKRDQDTGLSLGVSQNLPYGGSISLSGDTSYLDSGDSSLADRRAFSSSLGVTLSQPLLRGAGREVAMNSLIQAEHNLVYDIRNFELFRQSFSIEVAGDYYELVRQAQSIDNERNNLESFEFARNQAEALFKVGRTTELDVLRARRSLLNSRNRLIEAEEGYQLALDRFKVFLGLPTDMKIEILPVEPVFQALDFDIESSIEVALANRLDLMNRSEQVEDSARSLRIAENGMLPDLDLSLNYNLSGDTNASFGNQRLDNRSYGAGVSLELPLDRVSERTSLRQAQISHEQTLRSFQEFKDNLVIEIHSAFRELERRRQSLEIQRQIISDEEKNAKIAEIRNRRGEIPNRDLVEARNSLLEARNNLINEKVDYEITRLKLLKDLGILFIDEKGMWYE